MNQQSIAEDSDYNVGLMLGNQHCGQQDQHQSTYGVSCLGHIEVLWPMASCAAWCGVLPLERVLSRFLDNQLRMPSHKAPMCSDRSFEYFENAYCFKNANNTDSNINDTINNGTINNIVNDSDGSQSDKRLYFIQVLWYFSKLLTQPLLEKKNQTLVFENQTLVFVERRKPEYHGLTNITDQKIEPTSYKFRQSTSHMASRLE